MIKQNFYKNKVQGNKNSYQSVIVRESPWPILS